MVVQNNIKFYKWCIKFSTTLIGMLSWIPLRSKPSLIFWMGKIKNNWKHRSTEEFINLFKSTAMICTLPLPSIATMFERDLFTYLSYSFRWNWERHGVQFKRIFSKFKKQRIALLNQWLSLFKQHLKLIQTQM